MNAKVSFLATAALIAAVFPAAPAAGAHPVAQPAYLNPSLPPEVRAADLVHRMTLREKASQLVNAARAIPRLGVSAYDWWNEALHGVAVYGATEFPEPMGLAATFDAPGIREMAKDISVEGRVVHEDAVRAGHSGMMSGLDFWAPNINICRDPRWGRCQETYGEDPFLTGRLAVAFVTGMQGSNPRYYRAIATPKHFDDYSGPEPTRQFMDEDISRHDLEDTYLPAFRAAVVLGHAGSVMCSYVAINGEPACANRFLLQRTLRGAWHFQGYVVSDCGAVREIFSAHHFRPTRAQASAMALERGVDNECAGFGAPTGDGDYESYIQAVRQGYLSVRAIDRALIRLFTARIRLGMFDPPSMVPYDHVPQSELNSPAHRALALRLAEESMVLLKNDGVLPLKRSVQHIAVVGPLADHAAVLLGNYSGVPTHTVTVLEGLKAEFPKATITYVPGTQFLSGRADPLPTSVLTTPDGKPGVEAQYGSGLAIGSMPRTMISRIDPTVVVSASDIPAALKGKGLITVHWTGFLDPQKSGDYTLGIRANGVARVTLGDEPFIQKLGLGSDFGRIHLEKGQRLKLDVVYSGQGRAPEAQLLWAPVENAPDPAAVAAARRADVIIAVVGLTSLLEGEQMPVHEPGFLGGDRTNLRIPAPEQALVRAVAATGKPLVVVLINGSALAARWEKAHADAIIEAWYSGEEGGAAIAATLSGDNDPAGRLPLTFYKDVHQLPQFADYSMAGRTYRYFTAKPLWPFGYGLSYTTFKYGDLTLPSSIAAGAPLDASVKVTNTGKVAGDEVVQLYLEFPDVPGAPIRALRGFQRVHLVPGESRTVRFHLARRDLSMVTTTGDIVVAQGKYTLSIGGGQPDAGAPSVRGHFRVAGQIMLPE